MNGKMFSFLFIHKHIEIKHCTHTLFFTQNTILKQHQNASALIYLRLTYSFRNEYSLKINQHSSIAPYNFFFTVQLSLYVLHKK